MRRFDLEHGLIVAIALLVSSDLVMASRFGPIPGVTGSTASNGNNCTICHSGATGGLGSVQILGAPAMYQFDQLYNLTVRISDPVQVGAGFQLSVEDVAGTHVGTLIASDAVNTQLNGGDDNFINHTDTGVDNSVANWNGFAEYNLGWQSPASDVGPITFWAAGNAINNNSINTGDRIYTTSTTAGPGFPVPAVSTGGLLGFAFLNVTIGAILLRRRENRVRS